jgi:hypothetical protein
MKKIFLFAFALLSIVAVNAQNNRSAAGSKASSDPMVNGIPYSQYKAQQEALKQVALKKAAEAKAAEAAQSEANNRSTTAPIDDIKPVPLVTKAAEPTAPTGFPGVNLVKVELPVITADAQVTNTAAAPVTTAIAPHVDKTVTGKLIQAPVVNVKSDDATKPVANDANVQVMQAAPSGSKN